MTRYQMVQAGLILLLGALAVANVLAGGIAGCALCGTAATWIVLQDDGDDDGVADE